MESTEVIEPIESAPVVTDDTKPVIDTPEGTAPEGDVESKEQAKEKVFTQSEVDALIQKRLLKEERRVHRRIEAQQREQQMAQIAKVEPRRDDFRDDEAFADAQIQHLAVKKAEQILAEREQARAAEQRTETFIEKAEKASERYPDFQTVVSNPALQINDHMAEFIAESETGADVAYYLGKNPLKASQIAKLSPVGAARELARIESELASKPKANPSNAPEPIKPVGIRGKPASSSLPSDDDDTATWMRKERERLAKRYR